MAKVNKTQVSENSKKALALPLSFSNLEELRKSLNRYPEDAPGALFYFMLGKDVCSPEMLKEMFALNDKFLPLVFDEFRDVYCEKNVRWILENSLLIDENGEYVSISLSPAQQKLRKLLLKIVIVSRYVCLNEELEDEFGIELSYDKYDEVLEENTITEEELMDALKTYQSEHRA